MGIFGLWAKTDLAHDSRSLLQSSGEKLLHIRMSNVQDVIAACGRQGPCLSLGIREHLSMEVTLSQDVLGADFSNLLT
jgi:hypothetical protein